MKEGFSLIELLVVVLMVGILSAVALPQYHKAVAKARASELLQAGTSLAKAQNIYFIANNSYAQDLEFLDVEIEQPEGYVLATTTSENGKGGFWFSKAGSRMGISGLYFYLSGGEIDTINCYAPASLEGVCSSLIPCTEVLEAGGSSTVCSQYM